MSIATLLTVLVVLAIVGLICWGINALPGIHPTIKIIIQVIVGVICLLWVLNMLLPGHGLGLRL